MDSRGDESRQGLYGKDKRVQGTFKDASPREPENMVLSDTMDDVYTFVGLSQGYSVLYMSVTEGRSPNIKPPSPIHSEFQTG